MRSWSIPAGRLFGIEIRVHLTFLFLLVFVWTQYASQDTAAALRGLALVGIIFGSVILHELGHALVARGAAYADFDHDGDPDMYFSTYDHAIYVYRNDNGVFTLTPLLPDDGQWTKAVAFLPDASAKCDDLVVLDQNQTLKRYACK